MKNYIEQLKDKLDLLGFNETEDYGAFFQSIADILLNHVLIAKNERLYEITEIEFYLFSPTHPDVIAYPRIFENGGQWFFHQSGVDLSFKSDDIVFGGILIRGICEHKAGAQPIIGPLKCVYTLWDHFDAFNPTPDSYPHIVECDDSLGKNITKLPRWITVPNGKTREDKIEEWIKRLPEIDRVNLKTSTADMAKAVFDNEYRFKAV